MRRDGLTEAPGSPGITRRLASEGPGCNLIRSIVDPGTVPGWHHHGDYHVYGFMVSGTARFDGGPGGHEATTVWPGEFLHVPPRAVHRGVNLSGTEAQEVLLFLLGSGAVVVNVDAPEPLDS